MYISLIFLLGQAPQLPTSNELLASFEAACAQVESFDVSVRCKSNLNYAPPPRGFNDFVDTASTRELGFRQQYSRGRSHVEHYGLNAANAKTKPWIITYNGTEGRYFDPAKNVGFVAKYVPVALPQLYTNFILEALPGFPYPKVVKERPADLVTVARKDELLVLQVAAAPNQNLPFSGSAYDFYFDKQCGYIPRQIDLSVLVNGKKTIHARITNELGKVANTNVWFPKKSKRTSYIIEAKSKFFGKELGTEEYEVDLKASQFNAKIDERIFKLTFPPDAQVTHIE